MTRHQVIARVDCHVHGRTRSRNTDAPGDNGGSKPASVRGVCLPKGKHRVARARPEEALQNLPSASAGSTEREALFWKSMAYAFLKQDEDEWQCSAGHSCGGVVTRGATRPTALAGTEEAGLL